MFPVVLLSVFFLSLAVGSEPVSSEQVGFLRKLAKAAVERTHQKITYDPSYFQIAYPNGDVPPDKGVCTDVVIRSYRTLGVDLQKDVHEDMTANFSLYPKRYGLKRPDPNIDHRRVPNLSAFLRRKGDSLTLSKEAKDYLPGDIVVWDLMTGQNHIGIVSDLTARTSQNPLIVHNIGRGDVLEDVLFDWPILGHYRYFGPKAKSQISRK